MITLRNEENCCTYPILRGEELERKEPWLFTLKEALNKSRSESVLKGRGFSRAANGPEKLGLVAQCFSFGSPLRELFSSQNCRVMRLVQAEVQT